MRSGDLFLEVASAKQSSALRTLRKMAHIDITVVPHNTLNYSRGVISAADLLNVSTEEIKENMVDQRSVKFGALRFGGMARCLTQAPHPDLFDA
ncbi:hypothetical protein TNCV_722991 [Trichonephila clavipes]|nr:hypothetical protein TNCV_722991 [Trichonephila clavipes]